MDELLVRLKAVRAHLTGMASPGSTPGHSDSNPSFPALTPAMIAQTPPTPHPGLRTPSQPMQSMRGVPAGTPHVVKPPPPPPDAMGDEDAAPQKGRARSRPPPFHPAPDSNPPAAASRGVPARVAWAVATVAVVALASGIFWVRGLRPVRPAHPAATAAPGPVAAAARDFARSIAPPPVVETAPVPAAYATANAGTTLVTITSAPAGAAVLDADDRLLGTTPFDLRVPADKPLQLTLKHDGYKPYTLKKQVEGEKVSLSVTMKTAKSDGYQTPNRRSVGYKDDPY